ncbi:MAG: hypothetical protein HYR49_02790 [Gammaproteobacteria bacterium]|nr:hypothetical protein [Gammaproteobacteria bacterium]
MKISRVLFCALLAAGCSQYNVVGTGPQTIGSLVLVPAQQWNRAPTMNSPGNLPTWTADGITLNSISFFADVEDGEPLVRTAKEGDFPVFRADMLPDEIVDVLERTVAKMFQATISPSGRLKPTSFAGETGFEYSFEMVTSDGLTRKALAVGAVRGGNLQLVLYQGTRMVYFDKELTNVQALLSTATIK